MRSLTCLLENRVYGYKNLRSPVQEDFATKSARTGLMHRSKAHLLFDNLVGEREQLGRNFHAERLGGFQVDQNLKLGRLHHG
jgi:hypothetical protein